MTKLQKQIDDLKQVLEAGDVILRKLLEEEEAEKEHVWEHGDVFENCCGIQIYLKQEGGEFTINLEREDSNGTPRYQLIGAKFLFNIKEKI